MLDFDTMLMHVGEFGLYQKILFIFQAPFCIFVTFVSFGQLFILLYPRNYWCEQHFACLTPKSNIPGAQRKNISFAWKNDGIFRNDPCEPNDIDDRFLLSLDRWDKLKCEANRSAICMYDDRYDGVSSGQRGRNPPGKNNKNNNRDKWVRPPYSLEANEQNASDARGNRRKRQSGGYGQGSGGNFGNRGGSRDQSGRDGSQGSAYGNEGGYPSPNGGGYPSPNGGGYPSPNGGGYPSPNGRVYPPPNGGNSGNTGRPGDKGKVQDGFSGGRPPTKRSGKPTPINSAFAGWPEPECKKHQRDHIFIGANSTILAERMRMRTKNKNMMANCKTRWNQSELPYATIVTEGDWWCNAEAYTTFAQAIFFIGAIVGGLLIGYVADTYGRVPALVIANVCGAVGGALSVVSTNIWVFSAFRFLTGMAFDNCFTMMYILVLEFCGPTYRTLVANLSIAIFYTVGTILLPILALALNNWRTFTLVTSIPMLLALLAIFFVPESARWLLSKGRTKEATKILRNFAKVNGRRVDEHVFMEFEQEANKLAAEWVDMEEPSLTAAFKTPRLRMTFIFLIIFWSMIALVYDGHNRNIMNMANEDLDVFWLFGIASSTEFPADILLILTLDRFGRRWLAFGSMTLSALFSFAAGIITPDMRTAFLVTAIISRFWVNVAFNIGLQYAAELLPTVIRAQGVNTIHIMGYVASLISPFVAAVGRSNPTLSLFLLGAFALTAGIVALFLSETLGEELPNTLEEAEAFGKNQSFWNCPICAKVTEEEYPISPTEDRPVVMRNALRGSIRGAVYRSSMISQASSGGSSTAVGPGGSIRRSRYGAAPGGVTNNPAPATELTQLRRITN